MRSDTVGLLDSSDIQAPDVADPVDVFVEANAFVATGEGYEVVLVERPQARGGGFLPRSWSTIESVFATAT